MQAAHHLVSLEHATAGMTLSDAILDQQGQVLLPAGAVLTAAMLDALGRHDVALLPILDIGAVTPAIDVSAVTARLAYLFRGVAAEPDSAGAILHSYMTAYRLESTVVP